MIPFAVPCFHELGAGTAGIATHDRRLLRISVYRQCHRRTARDQGQRPRSPSLEEHGMDLSIRSKSKFCSGLTCVTLLAFMAGCEWDLNQEPLLDAIKDDRGVLVHDRQ